jgi:hypothetical protein
VRPILKPPALKLIQNGRLEKKNLRKEMLSEEELKSSFANWRSIITKKSDFAILKAMDVSASSRRKPAHDYCVSFKSALALRNSAAFQSRGPRG